MPRYPGQWIDTLIRERSVVECLRPLSWHLGLVVIG
jgi:hypothetical protein